MLALRVRLIGNLPTVTHLINSVRSEECEESGSQSVGWDKFAIVPRDMAQRGS